MITIGGRLKESGTRDLSYCGCFVEDKAMHTQERKKKRTAKTENVVSVSGSCCKSYSYRQAQHLVSSATVKSVQYQHA